MSCNGTCNQGRTCDCDTDYGAAFNALIVIIFFGGSVGFFLFVFFNFPQLFN